MEISEVFMGIILKWLGFILKPTEEKQIEEVILMIANKTEISDLRSNLLIFKGFPKITEAVIERWNELYLPVIQKALLSEEEFTSVVASKDMPYEGECFKIAQKHILQVIFPRIKTTKDAINFYFAYQASPFESIFNSKWKELCLEEMNQLLKPEEFEVAFASLYWGGDVASTFISKWGRVCKNLEDIKTLVLKVYNSGSYLSVENAFHEAISNWREQLVAEGGIYAQMATTERLNT